MVKGPGKMMAKRAGKGMAETGRRRLWMWTDDQEEDEQRSKSRVVMMVEIAKG